MGFVRGDERPKRPMARQEGNEPQQRKRQQQQVQEAAEAPAKQRYPPPPPLPPTATAPPAPAAADGGALPPPPPLPLPQQQQDDDRSSRLCIKGLPAYVTEQRLREHLRAATRADAAAAAAALTDLKLLRTRDGGGGIGSGLNGGGAAPAAAAAAAGARGGAAGASRGMAFVGFRSEADADAVRRYFDRTFLDASRLAVEVRPCVFFLLVLGGAGGEREKRGSALREKKEGAPCAGRRTQRKNQRAPPAPPAPRAPRNKQPQTDSLPASTATTPSRALGPATRRARAATPS